MDVSKKVVRPEFDGKLTTINEFRSRFADNVTAQAISYAMENDLIDYMEIGPRVRIIVLTEKSLNYQPNISPKRKYRSTVSM